MTLFDQLIFIEQYMSNDSIHHWDLKQAIQEFERNGSLGVRYGEKCGEHRGENQGAYNGAGQGNGTATGTTPGTVPGDYDGMAGMFYRIF